MAGESVVRSRAASIFGEAAVMLLVGFYMFEPNLGGSELSDYAASATVWTFRVGGVALLVLAGLCLSGRREALLANAALDLAIGLAFAGSGVVLLTSGSVPSGMLIGLFGLMSFGSARWDWNTWQSVSAAAGGGVVTATGSREPADSAVELIDAERAAGRADALKRILESKRAEATSREDAIPSDGSSAPSAKRGDRPRPSDPLASRSGLVESKSEGTCSPSADKSARSSPPTVTPVEPRPNEPPPEGFLADLGRDDSEGR